MHKYEMIIIKVKKLVKVTTPKFQMFEYFISIYNKDEAPE